MYFAYGTKETDYLSCKDKRLAAAIAQIGPIEREVDTDLFAAVVHHIIGQQISMKAQATIWQRMRDALGTVDAEHLLAAGVPQLQQLGMTFRKAEYITAPASFLFGWLFWRVVPHPGDGTAGDGPEIEAGDAAVGAEPATVLFKKLAVNVSVMVQHPQTALYR